jgi:hypothetical protein
MVDYKFLFLTKENFKFIRGYENYMISDYGRVFSIKRNKFLKPFRDSQGYYMVVLYNNCIRKTIAIHRLVGLHFLENHENKKCIDHINNIRTDNRLENLRWSSYSENSHNAKISNRNTSGVKGITFDKKWNKYRVLIMINNKQKHIGGFKTLEEAKEARQQKANELFKEFTNICEKNL